MNESNSVPTSVVVSADRIGELVIRVWTLEAEVERITSVMLEYENELTQLRMESENRHKAAAEPKTDKTFDRYGPDSLEVKARIDAATEAKR